MLQKIKVIREVYDNLSIYAFVKYTTSRVAQMFGLMAVAGAAHAGQKISGMTNGWTTELGAGVTFFLLCLAAFGIVLTTVAAVSAIFAKKNQEPLKWQGWALGLGPAAVIMPVIIFAVAGSLGGGGGNASSTFNKLGIQN
ncbi:hypothetical protein ACR3H8_20500 [Pseudomonas aeruginosa]|uniref:hypothetical protein n=1 Tax=Pseudomonas aeruginosa group TaxID=136841 RepID=UPI0003BACAA9|nr:hypothetical protein [Pseudomonas aeruginosa]EIU2716849.1 hypothetical protein [Pseudomonas aeruginosa]EIU2862414.1 hypothetical protein [Pseudomonas aeruginosa]ELD5772898.1 hypothetical protein [Pseudomonas aeruginosa]ERW61277.1 hypothetical protein Q024_06324 [Pseudomonas aeruginosa BWHPSA011]ETV28750.1 hypothetical protein Q046_05667 [Pseudomonas aeruginosa BWHPSA041]